jgi:hypothetical protein
MEIKINIPKVDIDVFKTMTKKDYKSYLDAVAKLVGGSVSKVSQEKPSIIKAKQMEYQVSGFVWLKHTGSTFMGFGNGSNYNRRDGYCTINPSNGVIIYHKLEDGTVTMNTAQLAEATKLG